MILFSDDEITELNSTVRQCKKCAAIVGKHFKKCPICQNTTEIKKVHRTVYKTPGQVSGLQAMTISPSILYRYGLKLNIAKKLTVEDIDTICQYFRRWLEPYWKKYLKKLIPNLKSYKK